MAHHILQKPLTGFSIREDRCHTRMLYVLISYHIWEIFSIVIKNFVYIIHNFSKAPPPLLCIFT